MRRVDAGRQEPVSVHRFSPRPNRAQDIPWRTWGPEVFEEAARTHRPVFLSISAVWCHWCHVMDETSLTDAAVQEAIREGFVPVRVDRDQRPDVDRRYNMGGWPSVAILNAAGGVLWGRTYVPPEPLREVLGRVAELYAGDIEQLEFALPQPDPTEVDSVPGDVAAPIGPDLDTALRDVFVGIARLEDPAHAGFGADGPKFPHPAALSFLAHLAASHRPDSQTAREAEAILLRALRAMRAGELWDAAEGGFYRYTTRPDWRVPHYEKMLEDNVRLAEVLWMTGTRTGDPELLHAGRMTLDYMNRTLLGDRTFYGMSQDADEVFSQLSVEARRERVARGETPYVDPVLVTGPNLEAVGLLVRAWGITGETAFRDRAVRIQDFLWQELWSSEKGMAHARALPDREPEWLMELADQTRAVEACLALSGLGRPEDGRRLRTVTALLARDYLTDTGQVLARSRKAVPEAQGLGPEPASLEEEARLGRALAGAARVTGDEEALDRLRGRFAQRRRGLDLSRLGPFGGEIGLLALALGDAAATAHIVSFGPTTGAHEHGGATDRQADAFWAALLRTGYGPVWVDRLDRPGPAGGADGERPGTRFELCRGEVCGVPLTDPAQVAGAIAAWQA